MRFIFLVFVFQLVIFLQKYVYLNAKGHVCDHDNLELANQVPKDFQYDFQSQRRLSSGSPATIRITVDYSDLDNAANGVGMTPSVKAYLIKITETVRLFFTNSLKVTPRTTPVTKSWAGQCIDMNVPASLVSPGVSNSDLHILVTYNNDSSQSYLANAGWCQLDPNPTVGRIKYNLGTMTNINTTPENFESDFWIALHETTHVLGFSSSAMQYWIDPDTNTYYNSNANPKLFELRTIWTISNVVVLKSKKVVAAAQAYYNCPTIDGVPMENQGTSSSFGSHWERDLIANEYMTSSAVIGKTSFSVFTASLLLDTGYYTDFNFNLIEQLQFGSNKGCGFFTNTCNDSTQYPEFAYSGQTAYCDFYSQGGSYANSADPFSQCSRQTTFSNQICNNPATTSNNTIIRQIVGASTKCFQSTAIQKQYSGGFNFRCHKISCAADYTYIDVIFTDNTEVVRCNTPDQVIDLTQSSVSTTVQGTLNCPRDFKLFCTQPLYCPNSCSSNGFCNNGKCYCLPNFAGPDCSISCASPNVWDGSACIPSCPVGTYLNSDNVCRANCSQGQYADNISQKCQLCDFKCSQCSGPNNTQCQACVIPYQLSGSTCQSSIICDSSCLTCSGTAQNQCLKCNPGFYLTAQNQCQPCQAPCTPCDNCINTATKCLSCSPSQNYNFDSSTNSCTLICDLSCKTCSSPNNSSSCLSCHDGFYLNNSNQCLPCQAPCGNCINNATKCLSCSPSQNYNFDLSTNSCTLICHSSCKTCSSANNSSSCLSCNDGFYLNNSNQCQPCQAPCDNCINTATKCLSCSPSQNYNFDSSTNSCTLICDSSCKNCSSANNSSSCLSCIDGFYLNNSNQCQPCQAPCDNCINTATKCLSCSPSQNYNFDSSTNSCTLICDLSCKTCSSPNNSSSCLSCHDGFYLNNSNQCQLCQAPCGNCINNATKCLSCSPSQNYNFDLSTNSCTLICDSSCKTCSSANNSSSCLSCNDGFYLNNSNQCQSCQAPCSNCINTATKCLSCSPSKNYNFDSSTNSCTLICDSSCKTCSSPNNSSSCLSCNNGFYLNSSNQCQPCQAPCGNCINTATKCLSCTPVQSYNYDSSNYICISVCDSSCKTCSSPNNSSSCLSCNDGFYLNSSNQCQHCQSPCGNCINSATNCLSCTPVHDYVYDSSNNSCTIACDSSCKTCSSPNSSSSCLNCNNGFYLNNSNQCQPCQAPCGNCINTATKCLSCSPSQNYNFDSSTNSCTLICDSSCKTCLLPNNSSSCLSCNNGFYLNSSNQCQPCQAPCGNCINTATKCLSCTPVQSYNYNSYNYICISVCDSSCKTCSSPNNSSSCLSCNDGFYLNSSNQCQHCQSPCGNCINSATNCLSCTPAQDYVYDSSNNSCRIACDQSCKTCSSPNNSSSCLSCNNGFYLNSSNQCLPCQSPCGNCVTSSIKCLSCSPAQNYKLDSSNNNCNPICDSSCETCSQPQDSTKCLSCPQNSYLLNGQCITCKDGYYLSNNQCQECVKNCKICSNLNTCQICQNGYELDSRSLCITKKNTCHYTCKTCQDSSYSSCFTCAENRILQVTYYNNVGQCVCPQNTSDINKPLCDESKIQSNLKISTDSIVISSAACTTLLAVVSLNPLVLFSLIEFSQTVSFFTYVNYKPALGLDNVVQDLYYAHLTKVFKFDQLVPSQSSSRILQTTQNTQEVSQFTYGNSKIPLNDKYPYFLANSILICLLTVFVWFISYLASFINSEDNDSFISKLKRILFISLPILVFILTSQEFSLLIFFQFLNFKFSDKYSALSSSLSLLVALFMVLFTAYLTYKIQIKKVLCQSNTNIIAKLEQNKVVPIENLTITKKEYSDLQKFLILYKYIRQDSFLSRNFILIVLFRKIISSLIIVYGYQNPTIQISLLLANYSVYWLYIILVRPFKLFEHILSYSIIETVTLTMHIIYLLLIQSDGDSDKQKLFSFFMVILVILTVGFYFILSLVFLFKYIYQCFKKDQESQEVKLASLNDSSQLESSSSQKQYSEKQSNSPKKISEKKGPIVISINEDQISKNPQLFEEQLDKQQLKEKSVNQQQNNYIKAEPQSKRQVSNQFQNNQNNSSLLENTQNISGNYYSQLNFSQNLALNESVHQTTLNESQQQQLKLHKLQQIYNQGYLKRKQLGNDFQKDPSLQVKTQKNKFQDFFEDENSAFDSPLKSKDLKDNHLFYQDSQKQYGFIEKIQDDFNMK
ncbi:hypothetical protein ABPG72_011068 [Tetrahymena utriculariae]